MALKTIVICAVGLGGCLQLNGIAVQASKPAAVIRQVAVTGSDHNLDVEISATAPITALTQTVTNPDRLIVDFPEAVPSPDLHKVFVNRGNLTDVRVGLLSVSPRVTRVVLDLTSPTPFRVYPSANMIVVKLGAESAPEPEPAPTAATTKPLAEAGLAKTTSLMANAPPGPVPERSPARWILPILVVAAVLAMLSIALVSHIQNKGSRGL